jgi:hypothetical protein
MAAINSAVYRREFYGILNTRGDFWTPLAFESEIKAREHIADFWRHDRDKREQCLRTHKIVPVRIRLNTIAPPPSRPTTNEGEIG